MPQNANSKGTRLTGINPLAYMGVEPNAPPQLVIYPNAPTSRDLYFNLGTIWLVSYPGPFEVWMLVNKKPQIATKWIRLFSGAGAIAQVTTQDGNVVIPVADNINLFGGPTAPNLISNINTNSINGSDTGRVSLNNSIFQPDTNASGTEGLYALGGQPFLHNYGPNGGPDSNTFLGQGSGGSTPFTLTGTANTMLGAGIGLNLTFGLENTIVGSLGAILLTSGSGNTGLGANVLNQLDSGSFNIAIGDEAGSNYDANQSTNIVIGNLGFVGDNNTIRIGTQATHNLAYMAGVTGVTIANPTPNTVVNVGTDGQLGQVLLDSSGGTVAITQPSPGVINFEATAGGGGTNPFAFLGIQQIHTGNIWPGGSVAIPDYELGSAAAMVEQYDNGNNFDPGTGTGGTVIRLPATFTAPVSGIYNFTMGVIFSSDDGNANNAPAAEFFGIKVNGVKRYWTQTASQGSGAGVNSIFNWQTKLTMNDVVTFVLNGSPQTVATGVAAQVTSGKGWGTASSGSSVNCTFVSGFLIPEGATGGNFSQPFHYIQSLTLADPVAVRGPYFLGAKQVMTQLFDVGANVFPGDGLGNPAYFQAPATGIFSLTVNINGTAAVMPFPPSQFQCYINTPTRNYIFGIGPTVGVTSFYYSTIADLTAGNKVFFGGGDFNAPGFGAQVYGNDNVFSISLNETGFSGYRIA